MTLLPSESFNAVPVNGKPYKVASQCAVPECTRWTDHCHHLWRRSHGTNTAWVCLAYREDKLVCGNLVGLCHIHHQDVTGSIGGHKAWIRFNDTTRLFHWFVVGDEYERWRDDGPLKFQPPGLDPEPPSPSPEASAVDARGGGSPSDDLAEIADELNYGAAMLDAARFNDTFEDDLLGMPDVMREAANLLRRRAKKAKKNESADSAFEQLPNRGKKSWTIKVPDDLEDGYDVLESLLEAATEKLGRAEERSALVRYFVVVEALVFLLQHELETADET